MHIGDTKEDISRSDQAVLTAIVDIRKSEIYLTAYIYWKRTRIEKRGVSDDEELAEMLGNGDVVLRLEVK